MVAKGCKSCRRRHVRCKYSQNATACDRCLQRGALCAGEPPFRFKQVTHIYEKKSGRVGQRYDFTWDDAQEWSDPNAGVTFIEEQQDGSPTPAGTVVEPTSADDRSARSAVVRDGLGDQGDQAWTPLEGRPQYVDDIPSDQDNHRQESSSRGPAPPNPTPSSSWLDGSREIHPPGSINTRFALTSSRRLPLLPREGDLLRYYVAKIAPLFDVCDNMSHFGVEVPKRALQVPMMMRAILAVASRMQFLLHASDELESRQYHNDCLASLIPALSATKDCYDEDLLVTVTLLKFGEELSNGADPKLHALGSQTLLNAVPAFCSSGGLAEATSWQLLRATIYECTVEQQPWQLCLENYEESSAFYRSDDASFANVVIFLVARLVRLLSAYRCGGAVDWNEWLWVERQISRWHDERPPSFLPLNYYDVDFDADRALPELWMLSPPAVIGTQFYHTAVVLLNINRPKHPADTAFESAALIRKGEATASLHIAEAIGLSICHESVENSKLAACHLLSIAGYCITHHAQRTRIRQFLHHVEDTIGWRGSAIVASLQQQWDQIDGLQTNRNS